jgi:hypothetical protein
MGLGEGGRMLLYMPTTDFHALTDADMADLIAYVSAVAPVDRDVPAPTAGPVDAHAVRARQGATGLCAAHRPACSARCDHRACATRRLRPLSRPLMHRVPREHFSGGRVPGTPPSFPAGAHITPDHRQRHRQVEQGGFFCRVRMGKRPDGSTLNTFMPFKAFATLSDMELDALWAYLQTVPARATGGH